MNEDEIQKEWDAFIEYQDGSGKLYVTTTSALLFARYIADMAAEKEREACAPCCSDCNYAKREMSQESFLNLVARIYAHQSR